MATATSDLVTLSCESQATAQVVLKVEDMNANIDFFKDRLLFKVLSIFPADSPRVAVLSGHGLCLRLEREAKAAGEAAAVRLRLVLSEGLPQNKEASTLTAPCGAIVELSGPDAGFAVPPLEPSVAISCDGDFLPGRAGMQYRDLVPDRQGGFVIASHISIPGGGPVPDYVHFHKVRFQTIFCFKGWVRVVYEDQGEPFVMRPGDCVLQAPTIRHRVLESSDHLEVVEVSCPSEHETLTDHAMVLPTGQLEPDRVFGGGQRFARHDASTAHFEPCSTFPGFESSDFGLLAASNGVGSARVVRRMPAAAAASPSLDETPWISSALATSATKDDCDDAVPKAGAGAFQLVFVLAGSAKLEYREAGQTGQDDAAKQQMLKATASFALPQGTKYRLTEVSEDFSMLEVTINEGPGAAL